MGAWSNSVREIFLTGQALQSNWVVGSGGSITFDDNQNLYFGTSQEFSLEWNSSINYLTLLYNSVEKLRVSGNFLFSAELLPLNTNTPSIGSSSNVWLSGYFGDGSNSGLYLGQTQEAQIWYATGGLHFGSQNIQLQTLTNNSYTFFSVIPNQNSALSNSGLAASFGIGADDPNFTNNWTQMKFQANNAYGAYYFPASAYALFEQVHGTATLLPILFGTYVSSFTEYFRLDTAAVQNKFSQDLNVQSLNIRGSNYNLADSTGVSYLKVDTTNTQVLLSKNLSVSGSIKADPEYMPHTIIIPIDSTWFSSGTSWTLTTSSASSESYWQSASNTDLSISKIAIYIPPNTVYFRVHYKPKVAASETMTISYSFNLGAYTDIKVCDSTTNGIMQDSGKIACSGYETLYFTFEALGTTGNGLYSSMIIEFYMN